METAAIVGSVLALAINIIKWLYAKAVGREMSGPAALWLTVLLSLLSALGISLFEGQLSTPPQDPMQLLQWIGQSYSIILGCATTVYNIVLHKERGLRGLLP
jgi:hypothetical protein